MDVDDRPQQAEPLAEPPAEEKQKSERINGQDMPVGTAEEFAKAVFGRPAAELLKRHLVTLSVAKFMLPGGKVYRLAWSGRGRRWLAAENPAEFRTRSRTVAAGNELAAQKEAHFSE